MQLLKEIKRFIPPLSSCPFCAISHIVTSKLLQALQRQNGILIFFLTFHLSAYTIPEDLFKIYEAAKKQYELAEYENCQDTLQPYLTFESPTTITPYIFFYYALAAYKNGMAELAEQTFLQLLTVNSGWEQRNEVLFWLAQLRFEQNDYQQAFTYLDTIHDVHFKIPIHQMKKYFLQKGLAPQRFTMLLSEYPDDKMIAQEWLKQQIQLPFIEQDTIRMQQVAKQWDLVKWIYNPLSKLTSIKKDTYHVAVFLPFFIDTFNYEEHKGNYFILDLYQGIQAAVDQLQREGISVVVHAYDTQKSASITGELLEKEELKYMDLFIGPLYPETVPLVAAFAHTHGINVFNPLSSNANIVGNNPFVYLVQSSIETQVKSAANFTLAQVSKKTNTQIGVVYTDVAQDIHKAHTYKSHIEQNSDLSITCMLELDLNTLQELLNSFRESTALQKTKQYPEINDRLKQLTHIYIASQDELLVANILSIVQIINLDCCIIGDEAWLKKSMITSDQLQHMNIYFVAPTYIDYTKSNFHIFRKDFYNKFSVYPNYYATTGYNMMYFLGTMLNQHGTYFQKHWGQDIAPGQVFTGFAYGSHHDNQIVPIIRFQDNELIIANL